MTASRPARAGSSIEKIQTKSPQDIVRAGFLLEICIKSDAVLFWAGVWIHRL